jgi:heparanase 1
VRRACLLLCCACGVSESGLRVDVGQTVTATVDPRFLSFAVDSSELVGGTFWTSDGGQGPVMAYDFSRPRLRALAGALAPAVLRVGGTQADAVYYALESDAGVPAGDDATLTAAQLDGLCGFARDLGLDVAFTLNAGRGPRVDGGWTDTQARSLVGWTKSHGCPVKLWELGNELNAYPLTQALTVSPAQYTADLATARAMLSELDPGTPLAGPSSAYWPTLGEPLPFMSAFMPLGGAMLDVVTWHYYPQESTRCPEAPVPATPQALLDPARLDEINRWANTVETLRARHAPDAGVWLGETGNAQCGGQAGVSDRFSSSLWWLDELALMATRGQPIVARQTLSGGDYGMIDDATLDPLPDYFASLLWKRLMGARVLTAAVDGAPPTLRAYAHCTPGRPGAATALLINLSPDALALSFGGRDREAYVVTAAGLDARDVQLNGSDLRVANDGTPPSLSGAAGPVELPGHSYGFVVLPDGAAAACP